MLPPAATWGELCALDPPGALAIAEEAAASRAALPLPSPRLKFPWPLSAPSGMGTSACEGFCGPEPLGSSDAGTSGIIRIADARLSPADDFPARADSSALITRLVTGPEVSTDALPAGWEVPPGAPEAS